MMRLYSDHQVLCDRRDANHKHQWDCRFHVLSYTRGVQPLLLKGRVVASGGASGARPPIWNMCPPFHVWPPGCCIHPIKYSQNVTPFWFLAPPSDFWPPLLLNPGDGPAEGPNAIKQIRPRAAPSFHTGCLVLVTGIKKTLCCIAFGPQVAHPCRIL